MLENEIELTSASPITEFVIVSAAVIIVQAIIIALAIEALIQTYDINLTLLKHNLQYFSIELTISTPSATGVSLNK